MSEAKEILWNVVNSFLAGGLVIAGAVMDGHITKDGIILALGAGIVAALVQFKEYWATQKEEYTTKLFKFI